MKKEARVFPDIQPPPHKITLKVGRNVRRMWCDNYDICEAEAHASDRLSDVVKRVVGEEHQYRYYVRRTGSCDKETLVNGNETVCSSLPYRLELRLAPRNYTLLLPRESSSSANFSSIDMCL